MLFGREIIFEVFQPMWKTYLNVTDGQTTYNLITALCVASRGNNSTVLQLHYITFRVKNTEALQSLHTRDFSIWSQNKNKL